MIGGLFRNASNTREAGLPVLKDIPGLGTLFGHRSVRSEELELIVIVTARLVTASAQETEAEAPPPEAERLPLLIAPFTAARYRAVGVAPGIARTKFDRWLANSPIAAIVPRWRSASALWRG